MQFTRAKKRMHFLSQLGQIKVDFNNQDKNALQCDAFWLEIFLFKIEIACGKKLKWRVTTSTTKWWFINYSSEAITPFFAVSAVENIENVDNVDTYQNSSNDDDEELNVEAPTNLSDKIPEEVDHFFLLIMSIIIFFMQCGFAFMEAGAVRYYFGAVLYFPSLSLKI